MILHTREDEQNVQIALLAFLQIRREKLSSSEKKSSADNSEVKPSRKGPDLIDMMLSKSSERVVDSETLIKETQNRVWRALKSGYEYSPQIGRAHV